MFGADPVGKGVLELLNFGPCRKPIGAEHLDNRLNVVLIDGLPSVRKKGFPHGTSSINGEHFASHGQNWHGSEEQSCKLLRL
jgi:hypothetical protein